MRDFYNKDIKEVKVIKDFKEGFAGMRGLFF